MQEVLSSAARTLYWRTRDELKRAPGRLRGLVGARLDATQLLRLAHRGVVAIPDFLERSTCTALAAELDRIIVEYRQRLWMDATGSDHRAYAANRVSNLIAEFGTNPGLLQLGRSYLGSDLDLFFTLANRVEYRPGALGSGGGWHRDTAQEHQFKAVVYLSDVAPDNGPFEYVLGSHHVSALVKSTLTGRAKYAQHRFSEAEVAAVCRSLGRETTAFSARAGTLLLVDSSGIHRGVPIRTGTRHALTNYYYTPEQIALFTARKKFTGYFVDREVDAKPGAPGSDVYA